MLNNIKEGLKILVIGDLMIDHYIYGNCNRISPEAPVPVVEVTNETYTLGGAGNVLKNLIAFSSIASILSVTGVDENAELIANMLAEVGIDSSHIIRDASRCTTIKSRVLATNHQLIRLDKEVISAVNNEVENAIITRLEKIIANYDALLISDYNKGLLTNRLLRNIVNVSRNAGVKIIVDPKGADFSKYKGVNIIKPNKKEAGLATGINIYDNNTLEQACIKIKQITNCDEVIITLSEGGIAYFAQDSLNIIPTKALAVTDVTGAGDTVLASLGVALASGNSLESACNFANHAAAIVVSKVGSATATIAEINEKFNN